MSNREPHLFHALSSLFVAGSCAAVMLAMSAGSVAAPVEGEKYVYRIVNAYNNEARGQLYYQVGKVDPNAYIVSVTQDSPWGADANLAETKTIEFDWYAPALGRSVRMDTKSEYIDLRTCGGGRDAGRGCIFRGDWEVSSWSMQAA